MSFEQAEVERLLVNLIRFGKVSAVDHPAARVKVRSGDLETGWLLWQTVRAGGDREWDPPTIDEQVILLSPFGDPAQGAVIGGFFQDAHPAPSQDENVHRREYADGAVTEYDRAAHRLRITLPPAATLELVASGGVTITGDVTVNGDVIADGVSLKNHIHGGVEPGGGNTGEPVT